jgi:hypothetical protein
MGLFGFSFKEELISAQGDGTTLTAAAAATALPAQALFTLPANFFNVVGKRIGIVASGRISCVITTPGTARYDVRFGGTVVMDSLAMNLNIVAKTNVNWRLILIATARAIGTNGNLHWEGEWCSEACVGNPLPTVGGSAPFTLPYNSAPAVGSNFSTLIAQQVDLFFTQTVATGSMTLHQYALGSLN